MQSRGKLCMQSRGNCAKTILHGYKLRNKPSSRTREESWWHIWGGYKKACGLLGRAVQHTAIICADSLTGVTVVRVGGCSESSQWKSFIMVLNIRHISREQPYGVWFMFKIILYTESSKPGVRLIYSPRVLRAQRNPEWAARRMHNFPIWGDIHRPALVPLSYCTARMRSFAPLAISYQPSPVPRERVTRDRTPTIRSLFTRG